MKMGPVEFSSDGLRETTASEWAVRFLFGGAVSALAGLVSQKYGPVVGGFFLSFPSILPATVTLLKRHHGREIAAQDTYGSVWGSLALIGFALVVLLTVGEWGVTSLALATLVWFAIAISLWFLMNHLHR